MKTVKYINPYHIVTSFRVIRRLDITGDFYTINFPFILIVDKKKRND